MYHFWVTVNLTSDLVFRIILSGVDASWDDNVSCTIIGSL